MRRHSFMWKAAPAAWVLAMVTGSVAYAAVHQAATTGRAEVRSKALGSTIDFTMAVPADGVCSTATYRTGDLTTPLFTVTDATPGQVGESTTICFRNTGARQARAVVGLIDFEDRDVGCTGDEATLDATCGGDLAGELADQLRLTALDCNSSILASAAAPRNWGGFARYVVPGDTVCVRIETSWPAQTWQNELLAQSDLAAWRFSIAADPT